MITSHDNPKLKQIRKLQTKRERARTGLFVAEGEDLIAAAAEAGWTPEYVLAATTTAQSKSAQSKGAQSKSAQSKSAQSTNAQSKSAQSEVAQSEVALSGSALSVAPGLLNTVSSLGSGTRVIGVYSQRWSDPGGDVSVYLHGVSDPGNVGTIIRAAHAFADGPVILGPGCADPYSPKAVRASMGSIFARPPARARFEHLEGTRIAYVMGGPDPAPLDPPLVLCIGGERRGIDEVADQAEQRRGIPMRPDAPSSLNAAMAATVALYEQFRMARHG